MWPPAGPGSRSMWQGLLELCGKMGLWFKPGATFAASGTGTRFLLEHLILASVSFFPPREPGDRDKPGITFPNIYLPWCFQERLSPCLELNQVRFSSADTNDSLIMKSSTRQALWSTSTRQNVLKAQSRDSRMGMSAKSQHRAIWPVLPCGCSLAHWAFIRDILAFLGAQTKVDPWAELAPRFCCVVRIHQFPSFDFVSGTESSSGSNHSTSPVPLHVGYTCGYGEKPAPGTEKDLVRFWVCMPCSSLEFLQPCCLLDKGLYTPLWVPESSEQVWLDQFHASRLNLFLQAECGRGGWVIWGTSHLINRPVI